MKKPFMLIKVSGRDISHERFQTYEEAYNQMKKEFKMYDGYAEMYDDDAELNEWSAWVNESSGECFDWQIINLGND